MSTNFFFLKLIIWNIDIQTCLLDSTFLCPHLQGFQFFFYNRRYFLNFRRYLKNWLRAIREPGGGSTWNLAFCGPKNVLQRLQNIKCFWKKNPINFRVQISPRVKTMHNACIFPPISLLNISVYRLQPTLFIDSLPYLKKNQKDHKELWFLS